MKTFASLLLALSATWAGAQNLTTFGNITSQATSCANSGTALVLYKIPTQAAPNAAGIQSVGVMLSGTWSATVDFVGSVDGVNWTAVTAYPQSSGAPATSATANGTWAISTAGLAYVCVFSPSYSSGTAVVTMAASSAGITAPAPVLAMGTPAGQSQAVTNYCNPSACTTTEARALMQSPGALTASGLYCTTSVAPASGQTQTLTVRIGSAAGSMGASSLTCQITSSGTTCSDTTHSAALPAGEFWDLQSVTSATSGSMFWSCTLNL